MGAYEELWSREKQTFKSLARLFKDQDEAKRLPSGHVEHETAWQCYQNVSKIIADKGAADTRFVVYGTMDYPMPLRDAAHPIQCFYCRGNLSLLSAPVRVSIIGSREASEQGVYRAGRLARLLVEDKVVVVSGLARGIDTAAHKATIEAGGKTIAVLGTPVSEQYPPENRDLQEEIARDHLLISQVPVVRHSRQTPAGNRLFFPERNITMSALSDASVIVEAGETSGSLIQGRVALEQKRKLFIFDSCFKRGLRWPERFEQQGAIRVSGYKDIKDALNEDEAAED